MNPVLKLILEGEHLTTGQIGELLGMTRLEVEDEYQKLKNENILLGWIPILNPEYDTNNHVRAFIHLKINPEREGGYDRLAKRISGFTQVVSCYLMSSGNYDLHVVVQSKSLHEVATFVYERLATLEGVTSTSTHFMLCAYKEQGFMLDKDLKNTDRPLVSA